MYMQHRKQVSLVVEHMIEPEAEEKDNLGQLGYYSAKQCKIGQNRVENRVEICAKYREPNPDIRRLMFEENKIRLLYNRVAI